VEAKFSSGTILPETKKIITQEQINLYAQASRDFNPIHLDPKFAEKAGLGGTIAHGMLILAYISEYMTANFGRSWWQSGKINARFKAPAHPGDTITISGKITKSETEDKDISINCEVTCRNQNEEPVIISETKVRVIKN
jgi:acyl dehydratase